MALRPMFIVDLTSVLVRFSFCLSNRPIANMATISPKRGFSVATVAKGWSLVYMLMRVRYLVVFFTLETIKKLSRRSQRRFNVLK